MTSNYGSIVAGPFFYVLIDVKRMEGLRDQDEN